MSSGISGRVSVGKVAKTLKPNGVTWLRRTVLQPGSQGPDSPCPPDSPHRPELLPESARSHIRGLTRPR